MLSIVLVFEHVWFLDVQYLEAANLPTFRNFQNTKTSEFVLSLQNIMGGHETEGRGLEQNWGSVPPLGPGLKPPLCCDHGLQMPLINWKRQSGGCLV